ncbi:patatin-like phospholipase family protein [Psychrobacter aestuarii]|uniref:Patatin-like phospholipase family protein n=1 Tax=Psychrobacter aestuarii TaxID=556327 RepID=A0ABP3F692_9GAMM|nr:patatin-like phospholipase family protein [Psychrobacter aestuarii]
MPSLSFAALTYPHRASSRLMLPRALLLVCITWLFAGCSTQARVATAPKDATPPPKVALVLGGGGARGLAHIGVIAALEEAGITPDLVVGTSSGSLIGSLYASGMSTERLTTLALNTPDSALLDPVLSNQGFIEGIKLKNFINKNVGAQPIERFPIGFAAVATDKHRLTKQVFSSGDAGLAVQASCSVPNVFIAPRIPEATGRKYIDGGVVSLVPVDSARELGADIVIAVDVTDRQPERTSALPTSLWGWLDYTVPPASKRTLAERGRADVLIVPSIAPIKGLGTRQRQALIKAGKDSTEALLPDIKASMASPVLTAKAP